MTIAPYLNHYPLISKPSYVAATAVIIGQVEIGEYSSVWPGAVIRGDVNYVKIGSYTSVQDGTLVHVDSNYYPTVIGNYVTIGHGAIIHACEIGDNCLIGMGAILLDGVKIGEGSIIGAGCIVPPGKKIPPNSVVFGVPGKVVRSASAETKQKNVDHAVRYWHLAENYLG